MGVSSSYDGWEAVGVGKCRVRWVREENLEMLHSNCGIDRVGKDVSR